MSKTGAEVRKLRRVVDRIRSDTLREKAISQRVASLSKPRNIKGEFIHAVNFSGQDMVKYSCVRIKDTVEEGGDALDFPYFVYPGESDDDEEALYGSLLNNVSDGEEGIVQITGRALFRVKLGSTGIKIGELIYPLDITVAAESGKVVHAASGDSNRIQIPLGRAMQSEFSDMELIEVLLNSTGSGDLTAVLVNAATTANITLSGEQTIDGISLVADDLCLVKNQSTVSQNGIYLVSATAWTRQTDATLVIVKSGTLAAQTMFFKDGTAFTGLGAFYK